MGLPDPCPSSEDGGEGVLRSKVSISEVEDRALGDEDRDDPPLGANNEHSG